MKNKLLILVFFTHVFLFTSCSKRPLLSSAPTTNIQPRETKFRKDDNGNPVDVIARKLRPTPDNTPTSELIKTTTFNNGQGIPASRNNIKIILENQKSIVDSVLTELNATLTFIKNKKELLSTTEEKKIFLLLGEEAKDDILESVEYNASTTIADTKQLYFLANKLKNIKDGELKAVKEEVNKMKKDLSNLKTIDDILNSKELKTLAESTQKNRQSAIDVYNKATKIIDEIHRLFENIIEKHAINSINLMGLNKSLDNNVLGSLVTNFDNACFEPDDIEKRKMKEKIVKLKRDLEQFHKQAKDTLKKYKVSTGKIKIKVGVNGFCDEGKYTRPSKSKCCEGHTNPVKLENYERQKERGNLLYGGNLYKEENGDIRDSIYTQALSELRAERMASEILGYEYEYGKENYYTVGQKGSLLSFTVHVKAIGMARKVQKRRSRYYIIIPPEVTLN